MMATATTSLASEIQLNASIETLIDLESQVELRKQKRELRRQERERKRAEELKRLEQPVQDESSNSTSIKNTPIPQPSKTVSRDRLQKLEKELDDMKRMRQSRRASLSQEPKPITVLKSDQKEQKTEVKSERKLNVIKAALTEKQELKMNSPKQAAKPSGIVAKAMERFSKEEETQVGIPKRREQGTNVPIEKKAGKEVEKEVGLSKSVKETSQKLVVQAIEPNIKLTNEQPKGGDLSRYSVATESNSRKTTVATKPIRPLRTSTALAERAAIFHQKKELETISPVVNKRKSMPVFNFAKAQTEEETDIDSIISPSICVSHRFGQPPQVITRRAWTTDEKESPAKIKKELISDLRNHPTPIKKVSKIVTTEQEAKSIPVDSKQEMPVTTSPIEIQSTVVFKPSVNKATLEAAPQDLMTRMAPPLHSLKQPIKPKSQKKKSHSTTASTGIAVEEEVECLATKVGNQEHVERDQRSIRNFLADEKISSVSKNGEKLTQNGDLKEVDRMVPKRTQGNAKSRNSIGTAETPSLQKGQDRQPMEDSEAKAIRERILAKRKSTPLMDSKPKPFVLKHSEDQLSFSELRASLGRRGTENFRNATEKMIEQRGRNLNITTYRWNTSPAAQEFKLQSPLSGKASSERQRPLPKPLPQTTQSASVLSKTKIIHQQSEKLDLNMPASSENSRPSPTLLPEASKSTSVLPRFIKDDYKVESPSADKLLNITSKAKLNEMKDAEPVIKTSIQKTREQFKRITSESSNMFKSELNDTSEKSSNRGSLKKRAYSVSDLKAIHKKFEEVQQEHSVSLLKVAPKDAVTRKAHQFERIEKPVAVSKAALEELPPKSIDPLEPAKRNQSWQMEMENRIATKKLPPIGLFDKPVTSSITAEKDAPLKQPEHIELHDKNILSNKADRTDSFVNNVKMPMPRRAAIESAQSDVSNLQIVSPTPRKLSPEPILFHSESSQEVETPVAASSKLSSKHTDGNWRVRKELPFKLDMEQYGKSQSKAHVEDKPHCDRETGFSEKELPESIPYVATAQYDECIANSRRRASMPIQDSYLRDTMNRSPTGSDDSYTLDTPKENKKVSFSPTITTFPLDPVEEFEDTNYDYYASIGKSSKVSDDHYQLDQLPISELPPPLEPNPSYSRHQRTASAPQSDFTVDDNKDTSAFWKAFSSEMTTAPYIYGSSGRDGRVSMLPQPDRPENYYGSNIAQRKAPAWVKDSLEGGKPEPSLPAPSPWRQSGLWENLFGRKNSEKI
ncbi:hypothetical protein BGW37DRAFT_494983 [Umbelopsis sp. PMI_123]|nr:hypothetical protein BGW37DRAFT_494983 [Umbelopsis sp. PMI_123]